MGNLCKAQNTEFHSQMPFNISQCKKEAFCLPFSEAALASPGSKGFWDGHHTAETCVLVKPMSYPATFRKMWTLCALDQKQKDGKDVRKVHGGFRTAYQNQDQNQNQVYCQLGFELTRNLTWCN